MRTHAVHSEADQLESKILVAPIELTVKTPLCLKATIVCLHYVVEKMQRRNSHGRATKPQQGQCAQTACQ
jgi:hypothetical protein